MVKAKDTQKQNKTKHIYQCLPLLWVSEKSHGASQPFIFCLHNICIRALSLGASQRIRAPFEVQPSFYFLTDMPEYIEPNSEMWGKARSINNKHCDKIFTEESYFMVWMKIIGDTGMDLSSFCQMSDGNSLLCSPRHFTLKGQNEKLHLSYYSPICFHLRNCPWSVGRRNILGICSTVSQMTNISQDRLVYIVKINKP